MDTPPIQYAQTVDGLSIAYWTLGLGEPVVDMGAPPFSHLQMEWEIDDVRRWYELLATKHQLIRFDGRGTGLSDREVPEYSLRGMIRDLEAVVGRLNLPRFTLWGSMNSGTPAITYVSEHPERVSRLILWCTYVNGGEFFDESGTRVLRTMVDQNWQMFTDAAARARFVWSDDDLARDFSRLIQRSVSPEVQAALMDALHDVDVTSLLPSIRVPTLVMQREDRSVAAARLTAGQIPNARLVIFKGGSAAPYREDAIGVLRTVEEFLAETKEEVEARPIPLIEAADLSPREVEVLQLLAQGKSNPEIADTLFITRNTVQNHVSSILIKTNLQNRAQAAVYAKEHGLI